MTPDFVSTEIDARMLRVASAQSGIPTNAIFLVVAAGWDGGSVLR
jgi:hypothetical protein